MERVEDGNCRQTKNSAHCCCTASNIGETCTVVYVTPNATHRCPTYLLYEVGLFGVYDIERGMLLDAPILPVAPNYLHV